MTPPPRHCSMLHPRPQAQAWVAGRCSRGSCLHFLLRRPVFFRLLWVMSTADMYGSLAVCQALTGLMSSNRMTVYGPGSTPS